MRKGIVGIFVSLLLFVFCACPVFAGNQVPELLIDVALRADGSAYITQEFHANVEEGTEIYLSYYDSGYLTITDFQVSDENGPYEVLEEDTWDIDADFSEKAGKCGLLNTDNGVELCWGITEYGEHRYVVEYVLHDLVGAYDDADGFNYRFVNQGLEFFPTDAVVAIYNQDGTPITDDAADIWAFGYDGQITFEDGVIYAYTENALSGEEHMTIMVGFEKGFLNPSRTGDGSFEDVKERAFEGSDYEQSDGGFFEFLAIIGVFIGAIAGFVIILNVINKIKRTKREKSTEYYRDIPNNGDLNVNDVLGSSLEFFPDTSIIAARMMSLLMKGCLEPLDADEKGKKAALRLVKQPQGGDEYDIELYGILERAAGDNGILEAKELEKYCELEENEKRVAKIFDRGRREGLTTLIQQGCVKGATLDSLNKLTKKGEAQLAELLGFKKYLLDFSLVAERGIKETAIWQEIFVYAVLLDIADEVLKQIEKLYPGQMPQLQTYHFYMNHSGMYVSCLGHAVTREHRRQEAIRSGGSGGSASFGGGGGFSGGGGGGFR